MKNFEYIQPGSLNAVSTLSKEKFVSSHLFAGGTDVLGLMKDNIISPDRLINLKNLPNMDKIVYKKGEGISIGTLVKISDIAENEDIMNHFTALAQAAGEVASPQLRNVGTLGGNICQRPRCWYFRGEFDCIRKGGGICYAYEGENKFHCIVGGGPCYIVHPSDTAVALTALNASIKIHSNGTMKEIPIREFFILPEDDPMKENILEPGEAITEIFIPELETGKKSAYIKLKERDVWDFMTVSIAAVADVSGSLINNVELAFGGTAPKPWYDENINKVFINSKISDLETNVKKIFNDSELLSKNKYKLQLIRNLTKRILNNFSA
ncbi:MAG: xanthine dehydrogenase family protein subunit M [Melioribacteraceae bacterium]|nr:xanthine dehydrogenase family protein subunit M [Melioribacteraceae bacterium]MCF8355672.1 xanthine dehydrogenase family protein subunit M [Melioribacteraceae bacterium]MCF8396345.1 xanthine dehydrogenase family protein subunit M [Melioribacteraceae bacterium]MCF8420322.1 xanthine dehydrogenase family protein subunit M [Melioribacteraceae bacterium]